LDICGEFRFHPEVHLVVLFAGTSFFLRIHHPFIVSLNLLFIFPARHFHGRIVIFFGRRHRCGRPSSPLAEARISVPSAPLAPRSRELLAAACCCASRAWSVRAGTARGVGSSSALPPWDPSGLAPRRSAGQVLAEAPPCPAYVSSSSLSSHTSVQAPGSSR
jgi:hypothetical protein